MKLSEIVKQTIITEGYLNPPTGKGELALYNDAAQLGARVAKLEQALEFYAQESDNWVLSTELRKDLGARAREALKEIE